MFKVYGIKADPITFQLLITGMFEISLDTYEAMNNHPELNEKLFEQLKHAMVRYKETEMAIEKLRNNK